MSSVDAEELALFPKTAPSSVLAKVRWRTSLTRATRVSALFPEYIFVRVEQLWRDISRLPGVIRSVMSGDEPAHVPGDIIAEIRSREQGAFVELPKRRLKLRSRTDHLWPADAGAMPVRRHIKVLLQLLGAERQVG